jgi:Fibronectin type III-like domain
LPVPHPTSSTRSAGADGGGREEGLVVAIERPLEVIGMGSPDGALVTATGVTLPAQQLIGFARVDLEPGTSKTVEFVVPMSLLAYTGISGDVVMEPGPIEVSAGSSSDDLRSTATLTVTGQTRTVTGEERAFLSDATVN